MVRQPASVRADGTVYLEPPINIPFTAAAIAQGFDLDIVDCLPTLDGEVSLCCSLTTEECEGWSDEIEEWEGPDPEIPVDTVGELSIDGQPSIVSLDQSSSAGMQSSMQNSSVVTGTACWAKQDLLHLSTLPATLGKLSIHARTECPSAVVHYIHVYLSKQHCFRLWGINLLCQWIPNPLSYDFKFDIYATEAKVVGKGDCSPGWWRSRSYHEIKPGQRWGNLRWPPGHGSYFRKKKTFEKALNPAALLALMFHR